jgi:hypothetical protein
MSVEIGLPDIEETIGQRRKAISVGNTWNDVNPDNGNEEEEQNEGTEAHADNQEALPIHT